MADDTNTAPGTDAKTNVLEMIMGQASALTPDLYIAPSATLEDMPGVTIVGTMSERQRRLWTVLDAAIDDHNTAADEARGLQREIKQANNNGGNMIEKLKHIVSGGVTTEMLERFEAVNHDRIMKSALVDALQALFWLGIRTQFNSELAGKSRIMVFNDWSVGWTDEPQIGGIEVIVGGDIPPEVMGLLFGAFGRSRN